MRLYTSASFFAFTHKERTMQASKLTSQTFVMACCECRFMCS